jgi:hypothetical protein
LVLDIRFLVFDSGQVASSGHTLKQDRNTLCNSFCTLDRDLDIGSCNWFTSGQKRPGQNDFCANIFLVLDSNYVSGHQQLSFWEMDSTLELDSSSMFAQKLKFRTAPQNA